MRNFTLGCRIGRPLPARPPTQIVAWGDSLTAGGYTTAAGALFSPPRAVLNRGVGVQTSTEIAARQGGRAILLTLDGDEIPALGAGTLHSNDTFGGTEVPAAWGTYSGGPGTALSVAAGTLVADLVNRAGHADFPGPARDIGALAAGDILKVAFDVVEYTFPQPLQVGITAGAWSQGGPSTSITEVGHYRIYVPVIDDKEGAPQSLSFLYAGAAVALSGRLRLDNVVVTKTVPPLEPVTVTARSVSPVTYQGPFSGGVRRLAGTLAGVAGHLERAATPDDSGNGSAAMTFVRTTPGPAVACPPGSLFVPEEAETLRAGTAWIWVGRNNIDAPATVKADIAAMIAHLGHRRYLVAGLLNAAGEGIGTGAHATIAAANADLAALHGARFVDPGAALRAAGNGSPGDDDDIAAGIPPRSLRADAIHLNAGGNAVVAAAMHAATRRFGW
ncbi:hypothetical protein [Ensifer soli]|uniref:hypothetical protein n=1 Tax=Ciceribacter sp. sgz301302 TaxID=3342379 RepID=UPI0035B75C0D